jgi:hypothetical protein
MCLCVYVCLHITLCAWVCVYSVNHEVNVWGQYQISSSVIFYFCFWEKVSLCIWNLPVRLDLLVSKPLNSFCLDSYDTEIIQVPDVAPGSLVWALGFWTQVLMTVWVICNLGRASIAIKGHHEHSRFYREKYLIGTGLQFRDVVYHCHGGKHGST